MAKQIKPEEEITTAQEPAITTAAVSNGIGTQAKAETRTEIKPEAHVLSVLQAFSNYEQLYIDKQGGIYTPDTPEHLREMATLYKNPYFTQP